jgi:hypothetical protein
MHGGEFIVNAQASRANAARLEEINAYRSAEYIPISNIALTDTTRIFNTNGTEGPDSHLWLLVQSGQFIVNRAGTIECFEELEQMNNSVAPLLSQAGSHIENARYIRPLPRLQYEGGVDSS